MGIYRIKVVQRGNIIVDGVDSLEEAEEYLESCNPVDDVKWAGFLEAMQGGIELQKISIPDAMTVREFADRILVRPAEIIILANAITCRSFRLDNNAFARYTFMYRQNSG